MSRASEIAALIAGRFEAILTDDGWLTDIGTRVFRGKRSLNDSDVPCILLFEGDDTPRDKVVRDVMVSQEYVAEAYMACDPDNPNDVCHLMLADMKKAIFSEPRWLSHKSVKNVTYEGRTFGTRPESSSITYVQLKFSVVLAENLADP